MKRKEKCRKGIEYLKKRNITNMRKKEGRKSSTSEMLFSANKPSPEMEFIRIGRRQHTGHQPVKLAAVMAAPLLTNHPCSASQSLEPGHVCAAAGCDNRF